MKRYLLFLLSVLLVACAPASNPATEPAQGGKGSVVTEVKVIEQSNQFEEGGTLVAILDADHSSLAVIGASFLEGLDVKAGDILAVSHAGIFLESYPEQFGSVQKVEKVREEPDQVGLVYRQYEERAKADPVLVQGISELGLNIKQAENLSEIEKRAILWKFESQGLTIFEGTMDELTQQGMIDEQLFWKDDKGAFFEFVTKEVGDDKTKVVFDTRLWRTGMASLGSEGVTATWADGEWTEDGGSHYISMK